MFFVFGFDQIANLCMQWKVKDYLKYISTFVSNTKMISFVAEGVDWTNIDKNKPSHDWVSKSNASEDLKIDKTMDRKVSRTLNSILHLHKVVKVLGTLTTFNNTLITNDILNQTTNLRHVRVSREYADHDGVFTFVI